MASLARILRRPAWRNVTAMVSGEQRVASESRIAQKCEFPVAFYDIAGNPWGFLGILGNEGGFQCGRGDMRTKKGKRFRQSFGKCRPSTKVLIRRLREKWELPKGAPLPGPYDIA